MSHGSDNIEDRKALREMHVSVPSGPLKKCDGICGTYCDLDRAEEFFDRDEQSKDGFKKLCKACRAQQSVDREIAERDKQLEHIDKSIIRRLAQARTGGPNVPHSADLLERITTLMGGVNGMAMAAVKVFIQAPPGSPTQQKMISQFMTLTHQVTETGAAKVPIELLSDEEIEAEIKRLERVKTIPMANPDVRILEVDEDEDMLDLTESSE